MKPEVKEKARGGIQKEREGGNKKGGNKGPREWRAWICTSGHVLGMGCVRILETLLTKILYPRASKQPPIITLTARRRKCEWPVSNWNNRWHRRNFSAESTIKNTPKTPYILILKLSFNSEAIYESVSYKDLIFCSSAAGKIRFRSP